MTSKKAIAEFTRLTAVSVVAQRAWYAASGAEMTAKHAMKNAEIAAGAAREVMIATILANASP